MTDATAHSPTLIERLRAEGKAANDQMADIPGVIAHGIRYLAALCNEAAGSIETLEREHLELRHDLDRAMANHNADLSARSESAPKECEHVWHAGDEGCRKCGAPAAQSASAEHLPTDRCSFDRNSSLSEGCYVCECGWRSNKRNATPQAEAGKGTPANSVVSGQPADVALRSSTAAPTGYVSVEEKAMLQAIQILDEDGDEHGAAALLRDILAAANDAPAPVSATLPHVAWDRAVPGGDRTGYACSCGQIRQTPCERKNCPITDATMDRTSDRA